MRIFRSTKNKRKHEERRTQQSISIKMISFKKEREEKSEILVLKMCIDEEDRAFLVTIGTILNDDFSTRK